MDEKNKNIDQTAFADFIKRTKAADVSPGELRVVGPPNRKFAFPAQYPREVFEDDGTAPDQATELWMRSIGCTDEDIEAHREEARALRRKQLAPATTPDPIRPPIFGGIRTEGSK